MTTVASAATVAVGDGPTPFDIVDGVADDLGILARDLQRGRLAPAEAARLLRGLAADLRAAIEGRQERAS